MRVAIFLIFAVALFSLLGTFPTVPVSADTRGASLANGLIALTRFTGGRALYGSPCFLGLLGLLAVFLVGISLRQGSAWRTAEDQVRDQAPSAVLRFGLSDARIRGCVSLALSELRFKPARAGIVVKNRFGVWGPLGVHLGVLVVLLAGLMTYLWADVREVEIREGESLPLPREGITMRLDKFSILPYPGKDQAQQYVSRFTIKDDKGRRGPRELRVNHPLLLGATKIFQMRYRLEVQGLELEAFKEGRPFSSVRLEQGKTSAIPSGSLEVRFKEVLPDFRISPEGKVFSAGFIFRNPAAKILWRDPARPEAGEREQWAFGDRLSGHERPGGEWDFRVAKIYKTYSSGVRVSRDPGAPLAAAGYVVLIFSAFLSSFAIPRVLSVAAFGADGGSRLEIRGLSRRDPIGLEEEIARLAALVGKKAEAAR
ncbi:MAG: cytochrome c biogenesis protein ResB [Candidatus Omnitrophica bacterium]|nr:cytochrome c biogenesis protein ResB [Candidatus Omnitrophota bacterium]